MKSNKQLLFSRKGFNPEKSHHGGDLPHVRNRKRPLGVRSTMHLVLRSSKAKNHWNFKKFNIEIEQLLIKFARKNHIQILSVANVGNHLHLHIRVRGRELFKSFIRTVAAVTMLKIKSYSRQNPTPQDF